MGGSKAFKTWSFLDLGISVAAGVSWWDFETEEGKVLYINFEIHDAFFADRFGSVCEAKGLDEAVVARNFDYLGMRGHAADLEKLVALILQYCAETEYVLIIIDPMYKCLGDRDENSAGDMASLMNVLDKISEETGCAILYGHHFSKGNQSSKASLDRGSGSGVLGRDPDSIIVMTPHEEEDTFTVEITLRNFPPVDSFVVKREHPLMVRDETLDPSALRRTNNTGRPPGPGDSEVLAMLDERPLTKAEWVRALKDRLDMSKTAAYRHIAELLGEGRVVLDGGYFSRVPGTPNPVPGTSDRHP